MRIRTIIPLFTLSLVLAACGGGASAAGAPGSETPDSVPVAADDSGGVATDARAAVAGDYADEAWVNAGVDALYARDSFTFEIDVEGESSDGPTRTRINGTVRPADESAVVNQDIEGSVSQYVTIGTESWIDFGDGQYRPQEEPDESGAMIRTLWDEDFADFADDFVIAGTETMHGRSAVHLVIDPAYVDNKVEMFGDEYRVWTVELWLAEDDGHLVRAILGGPQAPISFGVVRYTLDITSIDCACPVHRPV